jgi:wyosine [tRNA(Phe)-imidazoG37] synthetase (radical SAM superfamily)
VDFDQIAAILLPTFFGTGILTWWVRGKIDEAQQIRAKLRAEQRERYAQVLNPYIQLFAKPQRLNEVINVIQSPEYRKEVFDFVLVADDDVLKAYVEMMNHFGSEAAATRTEKELFTALRAFGRVLIELRKSVGNKDTDPTEIEALQVVGIKDARKLLGPHE